MQGRKLKGEVRKDILVADDDPVSLQLIVRTVTRAGYRIRQCENGAEALGALQDPHGPNVGILDVMMPACDGIQVCRTLRETPQAKSLYLILLTANSDRGDLIRGLEAGADDYLVKPCDPQELIARVRVGFRVVDLQTKLAERCAELERAMSQVQQLHGLLPICCYCKKIRNDQDYWQQVEDYLAAHADVRFSHGVCPHCFEREIVPQLRGRRSNAPP